VGAQIKNFNAQAQIMKPKFLIGKMQAQLAQVKNKIRKAQIAQETIKLVKCKHILCNFFQQVFFLNLKKKLAQICLSHFQEKRTFNSKK